MPELELIRLDADAIAKPEQLAASLARFRDAEGAVLLGTQMVGKGHHFAGVELAAVIDADTGLAMPDFRAEERTFQLVTQLAGRSGRDAPGRVIVQTFQPDSRAVAYAFFVCPRISVSPTTIESSPDVTRKRCCTHFSSS